MLFSMFSAASCQAAVAAAASLPGYTVVLAKVTHVMPRHPTQDDQSSSVLHRAISLYLQLHPALLSLNLHSALLTGSLLHSAIEHVESP